jgi:signal transduction histidine kinase
VLVRVQRLDRDADWERLRFTVQDPGIGLETALQTDVFEGFELSGGEQVQRLSGLGLGLTLCKRLARLMGGDVGVESLPQQGHPFGSPCVCRLARTTLTKGRVCRLLV